MKCSLALLAAVYLLLASATAYEQEFEAVFSDEDEPAVLGSEGVREEAAVPEKTVPAVGAEYNDAFDEEEFVGVPPPAARSAKPEHDVTEETKLDGTERAMPRLLPRDWTLEYIYGGIILFYIGTYFWGRSANSAISERVFARARPIFEEQYHAVRGPLNESLLRRQDLFSLGWHTFLTKHEDTLTLDIILPESIPPIVFAVMRHADRKAMVKEYPDLGLTRVVSHATLPQELLLMAESEELLKSICVSEVAATLSSYSHLVNFIHITDGNKRMNMYAAAQQHELDILLRMIFFLVDLVPSLKLSKPMLERAKKARAAAAAKERKASIAQRQEAAQQKKLERQQKRLEQLEKLPPEAKEKLLEKEREKEARRAAKARGPKVKMLKG